jgi:hypothetical protein
VKWKHECCKASDDDDYHVVITDATLQYSDEHNNIPVTGHSFVAEIPNPDCLSGRSGQFGTSSPFLDSTMHPDLDFRKARVALEQNTTNADLNGGWNDMSGIPVEIIGVGFFDFPHGQTGRSPNNIEIHPILSIKFNPSSTPSPGGTGPTSAGVAAQNWEYRLVSDDTASGLLTQANDLGNQGWELVSVVIDPQTKQYQGYLKRKK